MHTVWVKREAVSAVEKVTPVLLTYNEESNIARTLDSLQWARRIVILDSGSTDRTEQISKNYANVDWRVRQFDCHGSQWRYAILITGVGTEYVLALDADMELPEEAAAELERDFLTGHYEGGVF